MRLPPRHAGSAFKRVARSELVPLGGRLKGRMWASRQKIPVYGVERTVVDVYSRRMHRKQLPGLRRDQKRARTLLDELQAALARQRAGRRRGRPLSVRSVKNKVAEALSREHMDALFEVRVKRAEGAPRLTVREKPEGWKHLDAHVLGRTLLVTNRHDWASEQIVLASRVQSHNEAFFRDIKDPVYTSMTPLRHRKDAALRAHALVVVLALLLSRLTLRRARKAGCAVKSVGALLETLTGVTRARLKPRPGAAPALRAAMGAATVPGQRTPEQASILAALGLAGRKELGTSPLEAPAAQKARHRKKKAA